MDKTKRVIKTVNFGEISQDIAKKRNEVIEAVPDDFNPASIDILEEYEQILNFVERKGSVMFLTGKAGTGKSTAIKYVKYMIP